MEMKKLYFKNYVSKEIVKDTAEALKAYKAVSVNFDVIGRTKHQLLSLELAEALKHNGNYNFQIDYDSYNCIIINAVN